MKFQMNVFKVESCYWWNFSKKIKQFFYSLKLGWQRATKGYCERDLRNLNDFYIQLFVESLRDFKNNVSSAPFCFYNLSLDNSIAPWENYIEEMARHFWNSIDGNVNKPYFLENEENKDYYEINDSLFDNQNVEEKYEIELSQWRRNEFLKAMRMLEDVFQDLWD